MASLMHVPKKYTGEARQSYRLRIVKRSKPVRKQWENPLVTESGERMTATDAYRKYAAWCRSLGVTPADPETYEKVNK